MWLIDLFTSIIMYNRGPFDIICWYSIDILHLNSFSIEFFSRFSTIVGKLYIKECKERRSSKLVPFINLNRHTIRRNEKVSSCNYFQVLQDICVTLVLFKGGHWRIISDLWNISLTKHVLHHRALQNEERWSCKVSVNGRKIPKLQSESLWSNWERTQPFS